MAKFDIMKLILAIAVSKEWQVFQLDVKYAFLNDKLEEQIFIEQP